MKYEYKQNSIGSQKINAKKILEKSKYVFKFNDFYLRLYKSTSEQNYFSCSLAIPNFKDDQGYALEIDFNYGKLKESKPLEQGSDYPNDIEEDIYEYEDDYSDTYTSPFCGLSIEEIINNLVFTFKEKTYLNETSVLLILKISNTPYYGCAVIDSNLYA